MDSKNRKSNLINQKGLNRVHINPNFKNVLPEIKTTPGAMCRMHVNPSFSLQKVAATISQDTKIHINPNFISHIPQANSARGLEPAAAEPPAPARYSLVRDNRANQSENTKQPVITHNNYVNDVPLTKSRYCLVRRKVNEPQNVNTAGQEETKIKLKLTKYKSVILNSLKNTTQCVKSPKAKTVYRRSSMNIIRNLEPSLAVKLQLLGKTTKSKPVNKSISKYKLVKKKSIPCPLFVKYGKCLREMRGRCPYVHDKKHVSICRNLLKGRCFDSNCRFSHELTSHRMPTCYFYLNGVCTKENCPYLHVKLNDNASVCPDFQKGYCEKGETCMQRHVFTKPTSSNELSKKIKRKSSKRPKVKINKNKDTVEENHVQAVGEGRYYKEAEGNNSSDVCEIKPKRCKLGDLPSFIQL